MNKFIKSQFFKLNVIILLSSLVSITTANEKLPDRWGVSLGAFKVDSINTTANVAPKNLAVPLGLNIDLNRNLDVNDSDNSFRFDSYYRFTDRHKITLSYLQMKVTGEKTLNEQFDWDGQTYYAGARIGSYFENKTVKVGYLFSYHHTDKVELAIGGGLHISTFGIGLDLIAQAQGQTMPANFETSANLDITTPLPYLSVLIEYQISPRWSFKWKYDALNLSFNNISGTMFDSFSSVEHRTFKNVGFGLGLNTFRINIEGDNSSAYYRINSSYDGLILFVKGYL
ncbi:MAG: DUF481 domain-containing protein [Thiohalomonadales bacterium]